MAYNASANFTVTPNASYVVDTVTGDTCTVSTTDNVQYTASAITAACTVTATFKLAPVNGVCGSASGGSALQTSAPSANLCTTGTASGVTGASAWTWACSGAHGGTSDNSCQAPRGYTVSATAGANGSITPSGAQVVAHGATPSFTATPNADYVVDTVTGCGISGSANPFVAAAVVADCTVSASFKSSTWQLTLAEGPQAGQPLTVKPQTGSAWRITQAATATVASLGAPALPAGVTLPHGVLNLRLEHGAQGSATTVVLTYPAVLPAGAVYYKYGRTADNATPHWYAFGGAQISGNTVTLTLQDGGAGDDDLSKNSVIQDPGGVALLANPPGPGSDPTPIPTLGQWALTLLAGALAWLSVGALRRRAAGV